jgi:uncharacterized protein (TIGR00369 family)
VHPSDNSPADNAFGGIPADASPLASADLMRQFLPISPYVSYLGMRLTELRPDAATLTLPFAAPLVTIGSIVHGGAIASLIDTAAMVAAWSNTTAQERPGGALRGATVGLTIAYLAPAQTKICTPPPRCCGAARASSFSRWRCAARQEP